MRDRGGMIHVPLGIPVEEMSIRPAYMFNFNRTKQAIEKIELKNPFVFRRIRNNICIIYKLVSGLGVADVTEYKSEWVMRHMQDLFERFADQYVEGQQEETLYTRDIWQSLSFCASPYNMAKLLLLSSNVKMCGNRHQPWQAYKRGQQRTRSENTERRFAPQDDETYIMLTALTRQVSFLQDNYECLNPYNFGGIKTKEEIVKHAQMACTKSRDLFNSSKNFLKDLCWVKTTTTEESDTLTIGTQTLPLDHEKRSTTPNNDNGQIVKSVTPQTLELMEKDNKENEEKSSSFIKAAQRGGDAQRIRNIDQACANNSAAVEKAQDHVVHTVDSTAAGGVRPNEIRPSPQRPTENKKNPKNGHGSGNVPRTLPGAKEKKRPVFTEGVSEGGGDI